MLVWTDVKLDQNQSVMVAYKIWAFLGTTGGCVYLENEQALQANTIGFAVRMKLSSSKL